MELKKEGKEEIGIVMHKTAVTQVGKKKIFYSAGVNTSAPPLGLQKERSIVA